MGLGLFGFFKLRTAINYILICLACVLPVQGPRSPGTEGATEGGGGCPKVETLLRFSISEAVSPSLCCPGSLGCMWQLLPFTQERCPLPGTHALQSAPCHAHSGGRVQDPAQCVDGITTGCCSAAMGLFSSCWQPACPCQATVAALPCYGPWSSAGMGETLSCTPDPQGSSP